MSRVHDAMRRAGQVPEGEIATPQPPAPPMGGKVHGGKPQNGTAVAERERYTLDLPSVLAKVEEFPFNPAPESHLIDLHRPMETPRSEEHTSELQSRFDLVCRLLLEKK